MEAVCGWWDKELLTNLLLLSKSGTISLHFTIFCAFVTTPLILSLEYSGLIANIAEKMPSFKLAVCEKKSSLNESDKIIYMFETKFLSREQKLKSIFFLMFFIAALSFLKCITCSYLLFSTIMLHNSFLSFSFSSQFSWEKTVNSIQCLLNSLRKTYWFSRPKNARKILLFWLSTSCS